MKRDELPVSIDGFADPKWKGRLSIEATDDDWMYGVTQFHGGGARAGILPQARGAKT